MGDSFKTTISGKTGQLNQGGIGNTNTVNQNTAVYYTNTSDFMQEFKNLKEEFSRKLQETLESLNIPEKEMNGAANILKRIFTNFNVLEEKSRKFLASAEYIKANLSALSNSDFSPAVALYGKAIENELKKKIGISSDSLGKIQDALIDLMLEYHNPSKQTKRILDRIDSSDLSKNIFSESYLGYSINPLKNANNGVPYPPNEFFQKIRSKRNYSFPHFLDSKIEKIRW